MCLFFRNMEELKEVTDILSKTLNNASDAETLASDALTSIDTRANEITKSMANALELQKHNSELKFSIEATKKALNELEQAQNGRQRRETEEARSRLDNLDNKGERVDSLSDSVSGMIKTLKDRLKSARKTISK